MTHHNPAIEVAVLTQAYGEHAVLRGVDLTVPTGTVHALLGPNGAGKTTMVRILSTLVEADTGLDRRSRRELWKQSLSTAYMIAFDMEKGIIGRFRTMPLARIPESLAERGRYGWTRLERVDG